MANQAQAETRGAAPGLENVFAWTVVRLAGVLGHQDFPKGDLAMLRRGAPEGLSSPAFWRVLFRYIPAELRASPESEDKWALVMQAMAIMAPNIHDGSATLGNALARLEIDSLEPRLLRLLSSQGVQLEDQLRLMARLLANKAVPVDWVSLASLLFARDEAKREKVGRRLARDYYRVAVRERRITENETDSTSTME